MNHTNLRIASLLPSTTDICISLGLQDSIVGITHECDFPCTPTSHPLYSSSSALIVYDDDGNHNKIRDKSLWYNGNLQRPVELTISQMDPHSQSQAEINAAVQDSIHKGLSLYNLNDKGLTDTQPNIILTQSLCKVCAVDKDEVDEEVACSFKPGQCRVLSVQPESLNQVVDTFVTIAEACGVPQRGMILKNKFWEDVSRIQQAVALSKVKSRPTVLFLEWLDPPFDAGHWIPNMFEMSGCLSALSIITKSTKKSIEIKWEQVYECDPDIVMIGCCGFDLQRNLTDAIGSVKKLKSLRAFHENRIYASDGNLYFARPGPGLREGIAILARCAYDGDHEVVNALEKLQFLPDDWKGWTKVVFPETSQETDIEDIVNNYSDLHNEACQQKRDFYKDPKTGYKVFTEYCHLKRGKCCGAGCRHCPFNHINLKDKSRIQQPAFLYEGSDHVGNIFAPFSSIASNSEVSVLFFSGGKDSFLTIRKLVKQHSRTDSINLVLLTTFDSVSRVIAHQEVHIDTVVRQANHLQIPLLAVPLRRGSGETYLSRLEKGLDIIRQRIDNDNQLTLVFGDLHLDQIRNWRENELKKYTLKYPLWKVPYEILMADLEESGVRVVISASTKEGVTKGMVFTRKLWKTVTDMGLDGFGEEGEFHTIAEVWVVSREQALGVILNA